VRRGCIEASCRRVLHVPCSHAAGGWVRWRSVSSSSRAATPTTRREAAAVSARCARRPVSGSRRPSVMCVRTSAGSSRGPMATSRSDRRFVVPTRAARRSLRRVARPLWPGRQRRTSAPRLSAARRPVCVDGTTRLCGRHVHAHAGRSESRQGAFPIGRSLRLAWAHRGGAHAGDAAPPPARTADPRRRSERAGVAGSLIPHERGRASVPASDHGGRRLRDGRRLASRRALFSASGAARRGVSASRSGPSLPGPDR
jgi:hypothetical protein